MLPLAIKGNTIMETTNVVKEMLYKIKLIIKSVINYDVYK